ncbi:MAG TPA: hypothetical protein VHX20_19340 [Terracidiphilus sp.]|jgi:hypothetical protein|nr:hypothetical protein [Terracidiphilus sp.]
MQPFSVRAAEAARGSQLVLQVLLSPDNDDIELVCITAASAGRPFPITAEDFTARKLRSVGCVGVSLGLDGFTPHVALIEPLEPHVINAMGCALTEYIRVLVGNALIEQIALAEVTELERMYVLPDSRTYHPLFNA